MQWSELKAGGDVPQKAGRWLAYEGKHHLLYSSIWGDTPTDRGGLYRLSTP
jgi:hypothetical protein